MNFGSPTLQGSTFLEEEEGDEQDVSPQVDLDEAEEGWEGSDSLEPPPQASERAESADDNVEVTCWPCYAFNFVRATLALTLGSGV